MTDVDKLNNFHCSNGIVEHNFGNWKAIFDYGLGFLRICFLKNATKKMMKELSGLGFERYSRNEWRIDNPNKRQLLFVKFYMFMRSQNV